MTLAESVPARLADDHAVKGSLASPVHDPRAGVESVKASPPGRSIIEWKNPPGRVNAVFSDAVQAELRSRPGQWALLRVYPGHSGMTKNIKVPSGFESDSRYRLHGRKRFTELYGRALP